MEVVKRYADRILAFYDGHILADGPTIEVMSDPKVQELVVGHHLDLNPHPTKNAVDNPDSQELHNA